jgi:hypothetical protein
MKGAGKPRTPNGAGRACAGAQFIDLLESVAHQRGSARWRIAANPTFGAHPILRAERGIRLVHDLALGSAGHVLYRRGNL